MFKIVGPPFFSAFQIILEKLINNISCFYNQKKKQFYKSTEWFQWGKSIERIVHDSRGHKNKINHIGIFFDLSKAYDVLNHKSLLPKLDT